MKTLISDASETVSLKPIYIPIVLLLVVEIFGYFRYGHEYQGGFYLLQVLLLWLFILGGASWKFRVRHVRFAGLINGVVLVLFLVKWAYDGFNLVSYKGFYALENYYAVLLYCMFFFSVLALVYSRKFARILYILLAFGNLALIYATSARSVMIGIFITACAALFLKLFRSKFRYLFYLILLGNMAFIGIYIWLKTTSIGNVLNDLSRSIFNKNLFSGRIEIWEQIFREIMAKPLLGHGVGADARMFTEQRLTAHNFYLQVLLENGIVGLVIMLLVLFGIWKLLNRNLESFAARWSACFMLGLLVYENLELTMTQNNFSIAMFQWLIITFGIQFISKQPDTEKEKIEMTQVGQEEAVRAQLENAFDMRETRISRKQRNTRKK
ncbi:O-antigen ligase family protein [Aciduricibacillus chroicocephali]|uniref:O-antigen ligase family protein n=1 Tax=Aciduricibacillus chroicocephali TaxID=3054939 RepID=A0ABY9KUQ7_9BACI|nr:O-antigen ligase family protein [Bacillaceae bacterium 44XB]